MTACASSFRLARGSFREMPFSSVASNPRRARPLSLAPTAVAVSRLLAGCTPGKDMGLSALTGPEPEPADVRSNQWLGNLDAGRTQAAGAKLQAADPPEPE